MDGVGREAPTEKKRGVRSSESPAKAVPVFSLWSKRDSGNAGIAVRKTVLKLFSPLYAPCESVLAQRVLNHFPSAKVDIENHREAARPDTRVSL